MSKITLDNLSDNLKTYLEGLGLTEEQVLNLINENGLNEEELKAMLKDTMSINELNTNSKTIIGAINELFQDVDNGKNLIATSIGIPLVDGNSSFEAMSEAITVLKQESDKKIELIDFLNSQGFRLNYEDNYNVIIENMRLAKIVPPPIYVYNRGDECIDVSGGFPESTEVLSTYQNCKSQYKKESDHLYVGCWDTATQYTTSIYKSSLGFFDITHYQKMSITFSHWCWTDNSGGGYVAFDLLDESGKSLKNSKTYPNTVTSNPITTTTVWDIESLTGLVKFKFGAYGSSTTAFCKIFEIKLY
jgi:hypothetical protein